MRAILFTLLMFTVAAPNTSALAAKVRCSDFSSWEAAQRAYERDPVGLGHLDRDKDGIACEALR